MEFTPLSILVLTAFILLVLTTTGIVYLTAAEWRDRRRRDRDKKAR
ncbi:MAG: hypothetical protein WBA77_00185 [Microcoleaceae cyanobacterium]